MRQRVQGEFKKFKMSSPNSRPQSAQVPKPNAPFNKSRDKSQQLRVMKGTGQQFYKDRNASGSMGNLKVMPSSH